MDTATSSFMQVAVRWLAGFGTRLVARAWHDLHLVTANGKFNELLWQNNDNSHSAQPHRIAQSCT